MVLVKWQTEKIMHANALFWLLSNKVKYKKNTKKPNILNQVYKGNEEGHYLQLVHLYTCLISA